MGVKSKISLAVLSLATALIWIIFFTYPKPEFKLIVCNVGQGDAILVTYQNNQILIDGGPNKKVLDCLSKYMPFWDKKIEIVVLTHPDKDHFGGLPGVFADYKVDYFMRNDLNISSQEYKLLESQVAGTTTKVINPLNSKGMRLGMIYLDTLYPDQSVENIKSESLDIVKEAEVNKYSIVSLITYSDTKFLLTGDIDNAVSDLVSSIIEGENIELIKYIKIPHHGSKNGISEKLLDVVEPEVAFISVGKNSYGHPREEILKMLKSRNIKILRTDEIGDIIVKI